MCCLQFSRPIDLPRFWNRGRQLTAGPAPQKESSVCAAMSTHTAIFALQNGNPCSTEALFLIVRVPKVSQRSKAHGAGSTRPLERLVAQRSNFRVVDSAALLDLGGSYCSYLRSACKSGTSRKYNVSPELLLLLMSESCIVCVSVLRPNMASVLSSQA